MINENNISTIATYIVILVSPILVYYGVEIDQTVLVSFLTALIGLIIAIWSSMNPNTFKVFGNQEKTETGEDRVLNDEYESDGA